MAEHCPQQLTGPERLQRRITVADLLTGTAVALWLVPITLVAGNVPHDLLVLVVALTSTLALSTFLVSVALRSRRIDRQWKEKADLNALRRHNELIAQLVAEHKVLVEMVGRNHTALSTGLAEVCRQVNGIAGKLNRASWDIYADAITDIQGGPEVVNSQDTRQLGPRTGCSNVVQFPNTSPGSNTGGF